MFVVEEKVLALVTQHNQVMRTGRTVGWAGGPVRFRYGAAWMAAPGSGRVASSVAIRSGDGEGPIKALALS